MTRNASQSNQGIRYSALNQKQKYLAGEHAHVYRLRSGETCTADAFETESIYLMHSGKVLLTYTFMDETEVVAFCEQAFCIRENDAPMLLPDLVSECELCAITDVTLVGITKLGCRRLVETSREFRALMMSASVSGISQMARYLDPLYNETAFNFDAEYPHKAGPGLRAVGVGALLKKQKGMLQ